MFPHQGPGRLPQRFGSMAPAPRPVPGKAGRRLSQDPTTRGRKRTLPDTTEAAQLRSGKEEGALVRRAHLSELDPGARPTTRKGAKHTQVPREPVVRRLTARAIRADSHTRAWLVPTLPLTESLSLVKPYILTGPDQERNQQHLCRASWHWAVTVVVGSGKVTTGSSRHPAVTQARTAASEGATVVLLGDCPHLTVPVAEAVGASASLWCLPVRPPSKASHPPSCPQPKGRIHSVGWCKQELLPEGGSRRGGSRRRQQKES